jgi:CxxC motif-containing protein
MGCRLTVKLEGNEVVSVTGNTCPRGEEYARKECTNPERILTSTVKINGAVHRVLPVITDREIPLGKLFEAMEAIRKVEVDAPVKEGDILIEDILGTGANVIASRSMDRIRQ